MDAQNSNPTSYTILDTIKLNGLNKPNYEFIGWYLDDSFSKPISVVENMMGNLDLYAKFKHLITPTLNGFSYIDTYKTNNEKLNLDNYLTLVSDTTYQVYIDEMLTTEISKDLELVAGDNYYFIKIISLTGDSREVLKLKITYEQNDYNVKLYYLDNLIIDDNFTTFNEEIISDMGFALIDEGIYLDSSLTKPWDGILDKDLVLYADMAYVDFTVANGQVTGMKQKVNFPFKMLFPLDLGVNKIAARAFISNLKVVDIDFNNVITEIGSQAFWNCRNLSTIDLTGVVTIGSQAFATCDEALTDIYIPSSVRQIGDEAFKGINKLKSLSFAEVVEYIGLRAFSY